MMFNLRAIIAICGIILTLSADWGHAANDWFLPDDIDIHGFISQGYLRSSGNNVLAGSKDGTFQFNEIGINFSSHFSERLRAGLQLFSRDLGAIGNNRIELDWAFGDYRWKDWLGIRLGKIRNAYGLYNDVRDIDTARTFIFLPQSIYDETLRETDIASPGIELYGNIPLSNFGHVGYQFQLREVLMDPSGSLSRAFRDNHGSSMLSIESSPSYSIAVDWETPLDGLILHSSFSQYDIEMNIELFLDSLSSDSPSLVPDQFRYHMKNINAFVLSGEYTVADLILACEYRRFTSQPEVHIAEDVIIGPNEFEGEESYYISAGYRFTDWFMLGMYYSVLYPDMHNKDGKRAEPREDNAPAHSAWLKEFVLSGRFDINDFWLVKLEGHFIDGVARMLAIDNPEGLKKDSFLFAIKTSFTF